MRPSRIRARLRRNEVVRFGCLYYPPAMMPAHAALAGLDALWLDAEHGTWDRREIQRMIALHHLAGIDCLVRTGSRNATELYHLLEDGASALMIPLVNTPEEAKWLVKAVKFPPMGERGVDGASLDNEFYVRGTEGYFAAANAETVLVVQIETPEALANVEAIAAVPGIDGLFLGPGDLGLRLGCFGNWEHPLMREAHARIAAAAAKHGVAWGRPTRGPDDIRQLAASGARLIANGSDFSGVAAVMAQSGKNFREALGS